MHAPFLLAGAALVSIPIWDSVALKVNETGSATLPFIWKGEFADSISELWLAIFGSILILIGALLMRRE